MCFVPTEIGFIFVLVNGAPAALCPELVTFALAILVRTLQVVLSSLLMMLIMNLGWIIPVIRSWFLFCMISTLWIHLPDLISTLFLMISQIVKSISLLPGTLQYVLPMLIIGYTLPVILGMLPYFNFESSSYCIHRLAPDSRTLGVIGTRVGFNGERVTFGQRARYRYSNGHPYVEKADGLFWKLPACAEFGLGSLGCIISVMLWWATICGSALKSFSTLKFSSTHEGGGGGRPR